MSRVSNLFRLQTVDLDLDACRARLGEVEKALSGNPAVQAAQTRLIGAQARRTAARIALHEIEQDSQALAEKIADAEQRLYSGAIHNPKELKDLQNDVESLKRRLAVSEENQLNALIQSETAETEAAGAQNDLRQAEAAAAQMNGELFAEREALRARVINLEAEQEVLRLPLPADDRQAYDRLRQSKRGYALARLNEDGCAICGIAPTTQLRQEARRGEVVRCTGCDRILYVE